MYGKNSEKSQHVGDIFRLHIYYRVVKNKKKFKFLWRKEEIQVTMLEYTVLYFTKLFFKHNVYYRVNLNN